MLEQRSVTLRHDGNNRGVAAASARGVDEENVELAACSQLSLLIGYSRRRVNCGHDSRSQM